MDCYIQRMSYKNPVVTTNPKLIIDTQRKRREPKHNTKEGHKTQEKKAREEERIREKEEEEKK